MQTAGGMRGAGSSCRYHLRASASVWASSRSMSTAEGSARNPEGALSLLHIPLLSIFPQDLGGFPCPCPAALRAPGATVPVPSPPALGLGCPGSLYGQHLALASSNTHPPALILPSTTTPKKYAPPGGHKHNTPAIPKHHECTQSAIASPSPKSQMPSRRRGCCGVEQRGKAREEG